MKSSLEMPIRFHRVAELAGDLVGELLRSLARGLRRALDLLPVLVGAGQKERVGAQQAAAGARSCRRRSSCTRARYAAARSRSKSAS